MLCRTLLIQIVLVLQSQQLAQAEDSDLVTNNTTSNKYCFRFTWIGAYMDYENIENEQCPDYNNIACTKPLMATHNNNVPDTARLWRDNFTDPFKYGCLMKSGYSCIRYTYTFKQGIQNITYMCAKVNATDGCYYEKDIHGTETEVCVCHSLEGGMPCNAANTPTAYILPLAMAFAIPLLDVYR